MRELAIRSLVAVVGIPLLLFTVIYGSWPLIVLIAVLQIVALFEWNSLAKNNGIRLSVFSLFFALAAVDYILIDGRANWGIAALIIAFGVMLLIEVFRTVRQPFRNLGAAVLFLVYVALPLALWVHINRMTYSARFEPLGILAVLLIATWVCDTAAYLIGRKFGRHKLYPAASPGKTVEGSFAGLLFAIPVLPIIASLGGATPVWTDYIIIPLIVGIIGQAGDLLESLMKREAGIKDTSSLLPGHGGILDRFDSLLLSTPFLFVYLVLTAHG